MTSGSNSTAASRRGVTAATDSATTSGDAFDQEQQQRDGAVERRRRVHFSDPLVSAAWSPPRKSRQWKRLGRRGADGFSGKSGLLDDGVFVVDATNAWCPDLHNSTAIENSMKFVENPIYAGGHRLLPPEQTAVNIPQVIIAPGGVEETREKGAVFFNTGSRRYPACPENLLCGVGLAWILFIAGWVFFPLWYVGIFSRCITSHKREVYGSVACSVGALVATAITLLVVLDAKEIAMLYASSPAAQL